MCLGPSSAEKEAAAAQRVAAETEKRKAIETRAAQKREDISSALDDSASSRGMRGGSGRRSLFKSASAGFLGRFS